jgi:hypothetical protein
LKKSEHILEDIMVYKAFSNMQPDGCKSWVLLGLQEHSPSQAQFFYQKEQRSPASQDAEGSK